MTTWTDAVPLLTGFLVAAVPAFALLIQRVENRSLRTRLLRDAQICQQLPAGSEARNLMERVLSREVCELDLRTSQSAGRRGWWGVTLWRRLLQGVGLTCLTAGTVLLLLTDPAARSLSGSLPVAAAVIVYAVGLLCLLFAAGLTAVSLVSWAVERARELRHLAARSATPPTTDLRPDALPSPASTGA